MERTNKTTKKEIDALHDKLVQTCIDFINEYGLNDIWSVDFNADELQTSADSGKWTPATDSYLKVEGIENDTVVINGKEMDFPRNYVIGESF